MRWVLDNLDIFPKVEGLDYIFTEMDIPAVTKKGIVEK